MSEVKNEILEAINRLGVMVSDLTSQLTKHENRMFCGMRKAGLLDNARPSVANICQPTSRVEPSTATKPLARASGLFAKPTETYRAQEIVLRELAGSSKYNRRNWADVLAILADNGITEDTAGNARRRLHVECDRTGGNGHGKTTIWVWLSDKSLKVPQGAMHLTPDLQAKIDHLDASGFSTRSIAEETGLSVSAIHRYKSRKVK